MKPHHRNRFLRALLPSATLAIAASGASAATLYWDIDGATPGAGGATPAGSWTTGGTTWSTSAEGTADATAATTLAADNLVFSAGTDATGTYVIALAAAQSAGSLTFEDGSATLEGNGGVITLGAAGGNITVAGALSAVIGNNTGIVVGGSAGLTKLGAGQLTLNGSAASTFTGGLAVNDGTLALDFTHLAAPANLVAATNSLTLGNGGTLSITGKDDATNATTQAFAGATFGTGVNAIGMAKGATATSATLNLGALTVNPGSATVFFPNTVWATGVPSTTEIVNVASVNGSALPASGKLNPSAGLFYRQSAAAGAARWVSVDSVGQLQALPATIGVLGATTADPTLAHQVSSANVTLTNTDATSYGLVLNASASGRTLTLAADGSYTINGILGVHGTNGVTINPGAGNSRLVIGPERNLVINMDNVNACTITAPIADNGGGASSVTIASTAPTGTTPGSANFSGANSYTGTTYIAKGTLEIRNAAALGSTDAGTIIATGGRLFAGAAFASTNTPEPITVSGTGTNNNGAIHVGGNATGVVFSGPVTLGADAFLQADGSTGVTYSGGINNNGKVLTFGVGGGATTTVSTTGISGSGPVVKNTAGTLNFNASNSYTGSTTINGGVLGFNNADAFQGTSGITINGGASLSSTTTGLTLTVPITLGAAGTNSTIAFGRTVAGTGTLDLGSTITGDGNLVLSSPAGANSGNNLQTTILSTPKTYAGSTTITTGNTGVTYSVRSGVADALPTTTVLTLTGGNGSGSGRTLTFDLGGHNQTLAGLTNSISSLTARNQRVTNTGAPATLTLNNSSDYTFGGTGISSTFNGNPVNPTAQIAGVLALTKTGTGKFTLAAGAGNTFNGATTIQQGILGVDHPTSLQNSPLDTLASIAGDPANGLETTVTTLTLGGLTGNKNLATVFTPTGGYAGLTALTLNPVSGASPSYSADIGDGAGAMTLTKSGAGTQILTGTLSHTGATTVNNGTLLVNGSLPAISAVTVNGGDLGGTGSVNGNVTVTAAGGIAPGTTAGTLAIGGNLDLSAMAGGGGKLKFELDTLAGTNDRIAVTGTLTLGVDQLGFDNFRFTNLGGLELGTYTLVTNGGITGGDSLDPANLSGAIGGFTGTLGISGKNIVLTVTPGGYSLWQSANSTTQGIELDHDNDGVPNGVEYFLSGPADSSTFTSLPPVDGNSVTWTIGAGYGGVYGVDYVVQTSANLADPWTDAAPGTGAGQADLATVPGQVKYTFPAGPRNFVRLKVTGP